MEFPASRHPRGIGAGPFRLLFFFLFLFPGSFLLASRPLRTIQTRPSMRLALQSHSLAVPIYRAKLEKPNKEPNSKTNRGSLLGHQLVITKRLSLTNASNQALIRPFSISRSGLACRCIRAPRKVHEAKCKEHSRPRKKEKGIKKH
jgi:hypothetical protein